MKLEPGVEAQQMGGTEASLPWEESGDDEAVGTAAQVVVGGSAAQAELGRTAAHRRAAVRVAVAEHFPWKDSGSTCIVPHGCSTVFASRRFSDLRP